MQLVLHCVAENTQMAVQWDGVLVSLFKKIHLPKKSQQKNKAQPPPHQTNNQANHFSDHCYRMHAGKGEGQTQ